MEYLGNVVTTPRSFPSRQVAGAATAVLAPSLHALVRLLLDGE